MPNTLRVSTPTARSRFRPALILRAVLVALLVLVALGPSAAQAQLPIDGIQDKVVSPAEDDTTYTALWRPTSAIIEARKAGSLAGFEAHRAELSSSRLVDLEHAHGRWAGLFKLVNEPGELDRIEIDVLPNDLADVQTQHRNDGFELVDLEIERRSGVVRVDGLFHPGVEQHEAHLDLDFGDFAGLQTQLAQDDKVLVDIETYLDAGGTRRWAGLWKQLPPATPVPDVVVAYAAPGSIEAGTLVDGQDRHARDFEIYGQNSGWMVVGLWQAVGSDDDWFRGIVEWTEVIDRADALTPDPGVIVMGPIKALWDIDIVASLSGQFVRPMPLDHDGPVGPGGP
ncbi:MAG: hypothetical protein AAGC60_27735 [Acidobacteriota bacterium]